MAQPTYVMDFSAFKGGCATTRRSYPRIPAVPVAHPPAHTDQEARAPALIPSDHFLRDHWLKFLGVSTLLLAPCFWHRRIVRDDLGSHLYNARLVQLLERGQAFGPWIVSPSDNVFLDFLLRGLGKIFDLRVAERIAVSLSVLVFFSGTVTIHPGKYC
jgi:hypothetical protein